MTIGPFELYSRLHLAFPGSQHAHRRRVDLASEPWWQTALDRGLVSRTEQDSRTIWSLTARGLLTLSEFRAERTGKAG